MNSQFLPSMNEKLPNPVGTRFIASSASSPVPPTSNHNQPLPVVSDAATSRDITDKGHMVEIRNLKKSYTLKPVLRGINLDVQQGERVALLGANGAGKTTLLRILACLTRPGMGTVSILGLDSVQQAQQVRALIGFVAHQPYLYPELTALENLLFFARMYAVKQGRERAVALLQRVGLERRMHERVGTFSRGQVQRLAWARALLHSPRLLLLDEPDTGLDQQGHELVNALLTEHSERGGSVLFTTHQLERVLPLAERVVMLSAGRVVFTGETANVDLDTLQRTYQRVTT
ncbi:MAG: heme ABC exporter ATP-binding protein CcmA [Chloroflexota bacterium]|nr:heme ABC exporter ATP-binding protein CcmA [Chloroflexota bacterium]